MGEIEAAPFKRELERVKSKLFDSIRAGSDNPTFIAAGLQEMFKIAEQAAIRGRLSFVQDLLFRCLTYLRLEDSDSLPDGAGSYVQQTRTEGLLTSSSNLTESDLDEVRKLLQGILAAGVREYSSLCEREAELAKQLEEV